MPSYDDAPNSKRAKKSDKAKKNFEKTGGLSQKHVRNVESLMARSPQKLISTAPPK